MDDQNDVTHLVELARAGNIADLLAVIYGDPADDIDAIVYTWLLVIADFGHSEAQDLIDDLLEGSSLRVDDDGITLGTVHHELAIAYLTGEDGLPRDFDKARRHLHQMTDLGYPGQLREGGQIMAESRDLLGPDAQLVFDEVVPRQAG